MAKPQASRIKDLPISTRPREKLIARGQENLTDAELLALLLGSGTAKENAVKLAEKLLSHYTLAQLTDLKIDRLAEIPGIGAAKATRIKAALEIGQRTFAPTPINRIKLQSMEEALAQLREFADKKQEYLVVLYLNARHELIQKEVVGLGSLNSALIEPKEIFAPALASPCASIILAHNHPSGNPEPSRDDLTFTKRIWEAGRIMGVDLVDHIIVAPSAYYSFHEHQIFPPKIKTAS